MSEPIISVEPSVSTAGNFLIKACRAAIRVVPSANVIVTIAGNPSGIAATAKEIDVNNMSIIVSLPLARPTTKVTAAIINIRYVKTRPSRIKFSCKGVFVSSAASSIPAI